MPPKVWSRGNGRCGPEPSLGEVRERVMESLKTLRPDHQRSLNPCPYKVIWLCVWLAKLKILWWFWFRQVSVSEELYTFVHALWMQSAPIGELSWSSDSVSQWNFHDSPGASEAFWNFQIDFLINAWNAKDQPDEVKQCNECCAVICLVLQSIIKRIPVFVTNYLVLLDIVLESWGIYQFTP